MSFGLGKGRTLDATSHGIEAAVFPALPDEAVTNPASAWIDPRGWFADPARPFEIEIGSGKGTFLLQQAELQPDTNFVGIEWAKEFFAYAADRVRRRGLENVRLLHADATEFLRWRVPDGCARVIHLYFSDPWPKARHHKRRVVQDGFLAQAHRVLIPGGELRIVTDHADYWEWMERHFDRWTAPGSEPHRRTPAPYERLAFERPASAGTGEVVGTNFERKYAREGRPFHSTVLKAR
ncbi:MAG: tRNA (guanosine(46)-N7)-methyltransferase TrmB [Planctomycetes bacterium]|nr:tRNA (guanosine(46)-N7)-methyltransferase TrmB [Planctomycetota bacterium]